MTLEQVAPELGITAGALSQIERGEIAYTQGTLEGLAFIYGCEPADLLVRDPADPEGIWSLWDQAQPGERRQAIEMLKIIISGRKAA